MSKEVKDILIAFGIILFLVSYGYVIGTGAIP